MFEYPPVITANFTNIILIIFKTDSDYEGLKNKITNDSIPTQHFILKELKRIIFSATADILI
jgi:hypothetical protein